MFGNCCQNPSEWWREVIFRWLIKLNELNLLPGKILAIKHSLFNWTSTNYLSAPHSTANGDGMHFGTSETF